jgi:acetyl-CoA synthetase
MEQSHKGIKKPTLRRLKNQNANVKTDFYYFTGDSAKIDDDGYFWITGRNDDVIKVSGHRLGSAEIEHAIVEHPSVAEAAVIGKPHEIKGESIKAFVILKIGKSPSEELKKEINDLVRKQIGPIASIDEIEFVEKLPKTRSGKIMRRILKAQELDLPLGDLSTLEQ